MIPTGPNWTSRVADMAVPAHRSDITQETLDGQAILYDPATCHAFRLNETAWAVWQLCDGHTTLKTIAESITNQYDIDYDTALDHAEQLVACFASSQLFELADAA